MILLQTISIGFLIAAPVGPIGILCMNRSISHGFIAGLIAGLGAATADAIYGLFIVSGLHLATEFLVHHQTIIRLLGGLLLFYLGIKILRHYKSTSSAASVSKRKVYFSTLLLTLTNPATILSFIAIFTGMGFVVAHGSWLVGLLMVVGIFLGSLAWWCILCGIVSLLRHKINATWLAIINIFSGLGIIGFASYIILAAVM